MSGEVRRWLGTDEARDIVAESLRLTAESWGDVRDSAECKYRARQALNALSEHLATVSGEVRLSEAQSAIVTALTEHPWGGYVGPSTVEFPLGRYARCGGCDWTSEYEPDDLFGKWREHVARLAAVPVPSEPENDAGLAAAVEALAVSMERPLHGLRQRANTGGDFAEIRQEEVIRQSFARTLRALLSERTATTGGGGSS